MVNLWNAILRRNTNKDANNEIGNIIKEFSNVTKSSEIKETALKFTEKFIALSFQQIEDYRGQIGKDEIKIKKGQERKIIQHENLSPQNCDNDDVNQNLSEEHNMSPESNDNEKVYENTVQQENLSPEYHNNDDEVRSLIHSTRTKLPYSTVKSIYSPSSLQNLKKEFLKPISDNITKNVRKDVVRPLQERGTQSLLDYFSLQTETLKQQQQRAYEDVLKLQTKSVHK